MLRAGLAESSLALLRAAVADEEASPVYGDISRQLSQPVVPV